jgi:hypothetical protein
LQHYGRDERHEHDDHGAHEPRDELAERGPEVGQYLAQSILHPFASCLDHYPAELVALSPK